MLVTSATDLPRLVQCIGSRLMTQLPSPAGDTTIREEGNAAHWLVMQSAPGFGADPFNFIDQPASNGVIVTASMAEHVDDYHTIIATRAGLLRSEFECNTDWSPSADVLITGRADNITVTDGGTLYVHDLKYGYRFVEPEDNWTLISHAVGFIQRERFAPSKIVLAIYQPRIWHPEGPLREFVMSYDELMRKYYVIVGILSALGDDLNTGPECHNCPSMALCPAYRVASAASIEASAAAFEDNIPNEALSVELDLLKRVERIITDRKKALENLAEHRLARGEQIENYALMRALGNRQWIESFNNPQTLSALCGRDMSKPGTISPAQAEKLGIPQAFIDMASKRTEGALKLHRISADKQAKRIFGKLPSKP